MSPNHVWGWAHWGLCCHHGCTRSSPVPRADPEDGPGHHHRAAAAKDCELPGEKSTSLLLPGLPLPLLYNSKFRKAASGLSAWAPAAKEFGKWGIWHFSFYLGGACAPQTYEVGNSPDVQSSSRCSRARVTGTTFPVCGRRNCRIEPARRWKKTPQVTRWHYVLDLFFWPVYVNWWIPLLAKVTNFLLSWASVTCKQDTPTLYGAAFIISVAIIALLLYWGIFPESLSMLVHGQARVRRERITLPVSWPWRRASLCPGLGKVWGPQSHSNFAGRSCVSKNVILGWTDHDGQALCWLMAGLSCLLCLYCLWTCTGSHL
jgi:hypothetical protein